MVQIIHVEIKDPLTCNEFICQGLHSFKSNLPRVKSLLIFKIHKPGCGNETWNDGLINKLINIFPFKEVSWATEKL